MKLDNEITFIYEDKDGNTTERTIIDFRQNDEYLEGYCQLRDAIKTFKKERIKQIIHANYSDNPEENKLVCHFFKKNIKMGKKEQMEICFTGFNRAKKKELIKIAETNGFYIRTETTNYLDFLICGSNAGSKKIEKAKKIGAEIMTEEEFLKMVNSGEIINVA